MDKRDIEAWANRVIDAVERHETSEHSFVELKAKWPDDHRKAAERIGGQANAAGGEPFLWLIGVDEKGHAVTGAQPTELSNWWAQVTKYFDDGFAPKLALQFDVPRGDKTVMALYFLSDRAPYVIIRDRGARGVPWREATGFRWARRRDLLDILWPANPVPQVEQVSGRIKQTNKEPPKVSVRVRLYLFLRGVRGTITLPEHKCSGSVTFGGLEGPLRELQLLYYAESAAGGEVKLNGSGVVDVTAEARLEDPPDPRSNAQVRLNLGILGRSEGLSLVLPFKRPKDHSFWSLAK